MPPSPDFMRPLKPADIDAADTLLRAAFPTAAEAALVKALRAKGLIDLELVLPAGNALAGYLAFSHLTAPDGWLALAPVAIAPDWQGQRWGTRLVTAALRLMTIKGATTVVLGKPSFYTRCGFSQTRAQGLSSPYPIKNTLIAHPGDDSPVETVIYPTAFNGV